MKLYEIKDEYQGLLQMVDDGELTAEDIADTLEAIDAQFDDKARQCVAMMKEIEGYASIAKAEADRLSGIAKQYQNSAERLKEYVRVNMEMTGKDKLALGIFNLTLKKPVQVAAVVEETKIPQSFFKVIPETKQLDKRELLAALKLGPVDGAKLEDGKRALLIK